MNSHKKKLLYLSLSFLYGYSLVGSATQNTDPNIGFTTPVKVKKNKLSDHDINQTHIKKINEIVQLLSPSFDILSFQDVDIAFIDALSEQDLKRLERQLNLIKNTPGGTKASITESLARTYRNFVADQTASEHDQNDRLFNDYTLESHTKKLVMNNISLLSSPVRGELSAVNISHIMDAHMKYDSAGNIQSISGGHAKDSYIDGMGTFLADTKGFLSPDGKTMGLSFSDKIGKTIEDGLVPEQIMSDLKQGRIIAINAGMQIRYISPGKFVGCYVDGTSPLRVKTQFPVLTISSANMNRSGQLYVGNLIDFTSDGSIVSDSQYDLYLTEDQFDAMMNDPSIASFSSNKPGIIVKNLTKVLQQYFAQQIAEFGMTKLPAPIFGIQGI